MIAYLIQAHQDPEFLRYLIEILAGKHSRFFIHVDEKSDLRSFKDVISRDDTFFLEDRVKVYWGGWSQVQAALNLLNAASRDTPSFNHYCHISGNHFPLRDPDLIHQYYQSSDREHINIVKVPNKTLNKNLERFTSYHIEGTHRPGSLVGRMTSPFLKVVSKIPLRNPRRYLPGIQLYAGSNWWTLTDSAVRYILKTHDDDRRYYEFFRYVRCADEAFFQTILGNSQFLTKCGRADVYTDWSDPSDAPCYLREQHLKLFASPNFCLDDAYGAGPANFARKFGTKNRNVAELIIQRLIRSQ